MRLLGQPSLSGGIFLREDRLRISSEPIRPLPAAGLLRIPLSQHLGPPLEPCVEAGRQVDSGQVIGRPNAREPDRPLVHTPVAGIVRGVTTVDTPYRDGVPAVELEVSDDGQTPAPDEQSSLPEVSSAELLGLIRAAGIELDLSPALGAERKLDHLIVNCLDPEPGQTVRLRCLLTRAAAITETAAWLAETLGVGRAVVVGDIRRRSRLETFRRDGKRSGIRWVGLRNRYPQSHPNLLVRALTGREVPGLGSAADVGVAVIDAPGLLDLWAAAGAKHPQTLVTIGVAGERMQQPEVYRVPLGTSVGDVAVALGITDYGRVIADSVMARGGHPPPQRDYHQTYQPAAIHATPGRGQTNTNRLYSLWCLSGSLPGEP